MPYQRQGKIEIQEIRDKINYLTSVRISTGGRELLEAFKSKRGRVDIAEHAPGVSCPSNNSKERRVATG
jgi:hypothetical protein